MLCLGGVRWESGFSSSQPGALHLHSQAPGGQGSSRRSHIPESPRDIHTAPPEHPRPVSWACHSGCLGDLTSTRLLPTQVGSPQKCGALSSPEMWWAEPDTPSALRLEGSGFCLGFEPQPSTQRARPRPCPESPGGPFAALILGPTPALQKQLPKKGPRNLHG